MPNFGDVALGLTPDWDRNKYNNQADWMLYTVGHTEGEADVYLTDEPNKEHQFRWADWRDPNEITKLQMQHYEFVKKDSWTKHPILWSWDAEGFLIFAGQRLMARSKDLWLADEQRRARMIKEARADSDREIDEAVPQGLIGTDAEGQPTKRRKRGI